MLLSPQRILSSLGSRSSSYGQKGESGGADGDGGGIGGQLGGRPKRGEFMAFQEDSQEQDKRLEAPPWSAQKNLPARPVAVIEQDEVSSGGREGSGMHQGSGSGLDLGLELELEGEGDVIGDDVFPPPLPPIVLGIPTVPRPKGVNYLEETLQATLPFVGGDVAGDPPRQSVTVLVVNLHGPGHTAFEEARRRHEGVTPGVEFLSVGVDGFDGFGGFVEAVGDGLSMDGHPVGNRKSLPTPKVKKQTRDLAYLLRVAAGRANTYLFMEDDMRLCEGGLEAIKRILDKAYSYYPDWIAVRASFGMNGIFIQAKDMLPFADFLEVHQNRRPPDHLVVEWFVGETADTLEYKGERPHLSFRYNIFEHLGAISTLRGKISPKYPSCFEELTTNTLFEVEVFDSTRCPNDDVSPCDVPSSSKADFPNVNWPALNRRREVALGHP